MSVGQHSVVGRASDSRDVRCPGFDTGTVHILSFLLLLIQELLVTICALSTG